MAFIGNEDIIRISWGWKGWTRRFSLMFSSHLAFELSMDEHQFATIVEGSLLLRFHVDPKSRPAQLSH
jgi:hypothetical protein